MGYTLHVPHTEVLLGGKAPWKETKITASEQVVEKLLENSVKYESYHFTEQKLAYIHFWKIFSHPPVP